MSILVTGGAGYIGAHVVRALGRAGLDSVVVDDLSSGHREFVDPDVPFLDLNVLQGEQLVERLADHSIDAVIHLAAFKYAGVSVERPLHTWSQNVVGTLSLLEAMAQLDVGAIVFSSSAAVYGTPDVPLVTEQTVTSPQSPYGESKLVGEWMIRDQAVASGLRHTSLRYFNVVGSGEPDLYDSSPHNLFPLVIRALTQGQQPKIFGDDYATPDGTCVRDYVHVADLALAHVSAVRRLLEGADVEPVYNLGSGDGVSVREIMDSVAKATGIDFSPQVLGRRRGDPARIVASGELAARDLDWKMRHTLDDMVASAWQARPAG
ncbi:UDP-glucose 4-epimerase GalE [Aeromicrobium sp.]|uniref:UDP-glucose 4-epimerase GalE n=1 Tax=Aeromicrobium sp. TaxID=1871063 RepID=UPI0028AE44B3|nr:UDP-glucose 4-epimerase GalE [Aeromicrobium sp.]